MATVPIPGDGFGTGVLDSSDLNALLVDPVLFLQRPPIAELRQAAPQSIASGGAVPITFEVVDLDTDVDGIGGHDAVTNNSRYTARYPGWYQVSGGASFASSAAGVRIVFWAVNGTAVNGSGTSPAAMAAGVTTIAARTKHVYLAVGSYVELWVFQNSGGPLNTSITTHEQPNMTVRWVSL